MNVTGRQFVLRSIGDLLRVPRDRRGQCLAELEGWLAHVEADVIKTAPQSIGPFIWTDDGVGGVTTERRYLERESLIVGPDTLTKNVNDLRPRRRDQR